MQSTNRWHKSHRSTKIPNVKLRPAPPLKRTHDAEAEDDAHYRKTRATTTARAHTHADFVGHAPLQGVVLCFTGIPDKHDLIQVAERLGARVCGDLTIEVTHLIALTAGSDKYRAAVQFHMCVVRPEWLYLVREAWLSGDDSVDVARLAEQCRLLPFEGLVLGLTGFDARERDRLASRIDALGGCVAPRIVWDGSITHLVCAPPSDGRHRKGLDRVLMHRALLSKCPDVPHVQHAARIRLVHDAWVDDCEQARVLVPESDYDATKDVDSADARAQRVASLQPRIWDRTRSDVAPPPPPAPSAPPAPPASRQRTSLLSWSRSASFDAPTRAQSLWATHTFHIDMHDAARTRRVIHVVRSAGGHVVPSTDEADYAIGPWAPTAPGRARCYATHHWIERCLYDDALVDVHAHPAYRPPTRPLPIPEARDWCITLTGIDRHTPAYHHTCVVIEAIGARMSASLTRHTTTHLLCAPGAHHGLKAQKAAEWQIPLVDLAFLEALVHPAASSPPRRRARPMHRAALEHDARPSITEAPVAKEPDSMEAPAAPMVLYDDPVARREQSKLMALVHGEPSKRARRS